MLTSFALARVFGKKLQVIVEETQEVLKASQTEVQRMLNRFQTRPGGSQKMMQEQVEKLVTKRVVEALEILDKTRPLYKWSLLAERQVNTLRMQLNYQIKRFDEVDRLMDNIFVLEPLSLAMKMARQYHHNDPGLEKSYKKGARKFKYEKGILIHALYAWILVKRKETDKALEILTVAKDKTESEVMQRNWQHLANNKPRLFSNAGLGEQWYALHLDTPPKAKASKGQLKGNPMLGRGKRRYF